MLSEVMLKRLVCRRVDKLDDWHALESSWAQLLTASPDATPWQGWDHLTCWWQYLGDNRALRIYVVENERGPVLILPLQLTAEFHAGIRLRWLEPIGMLSDINRPRLALGVVDEAAYHCALEQIWKDRSEWDGLRIDERPPNDFETPILGRFAASHRLRFRELPFHDCPYLDLTESWESYLASRSPKLRKNIRTAERQLGANGAVALRSFDTAADIEEGFQTMLAIQQYSWKSAEGIGLCQSEEYRHHYRALLLRLAERGACRVLVLYCGEQPVAGTIAIIVDGVYYSAQIAHDERYAKSSPGTLLEYYEFRDIFSRKTCTSYDFLGAALNNKLRWTETVRATNRILVMQPSAKMRLLDTYWFSLKPFWKRWRRRIAGQSPRQFSPGEFLPF